MDRMLLRDDQWDRIKELLPGKSGDCGVTARNNRLFLEAVLWIARTGSPWRDLPEHFGYWHRVYVRYNRWSHKGHWVQFFDTIADDPDLEYLMVDGSIVRVHQHGAAKNKQQNQEAMGKSRGGLSTKIHAAVDALGNPVRFILTAGQHSEIKQAEELIEGFPAYYVIADKGYDSDEFIAMIETNQATAVIPPKNNRKIARQHDEVLYRERNLVERVFQKLKHYRRIATRYERLAVTYHAMLSLVATLIWLN